MWLEYATMSLVEENMAQVLLKCEKSAMTEYEWVDVEDVKFLNIEEDVQGRDVMTFECPNCGESHKSLVFA